MWHLWPPQNWDTELMVAAVVLVALCTVTHVLASWAEAKISDVFLRADVRRGEW